MHKLNLPETSPIFWVGPPLELGPLPFVLYLALSAEESLCVDPYNQPVVALVKRGIRVFSLTLPFHSPPLKAVDAMERWAEEFRKGIDPLSPFIDETLFTLNCLRERGFISEGRGGLMGLSRGGLLATMVCAKCPWIKAVLGFAPMTRLNLTKEFTNTIPIPSIDLFALTEWVDSLWDRKLHFYIGNRDIRVGTRSCFDFIERLTEIAFIKGNRSPPIELSIAPSIGHMGHGTSPQTFEAGALWLAKQLERTP